MRTSGKEIKEVYAGDIVAAVGLRNTTTGDTLTDPGAPVVLEQLHIPEPVIHIAVAPKSKEDQDRLSVALGRIAAEDPSFRVRTDEETQETVISGMGELHLEIICDRLFREFKVAANVGQPQVAYRETVTKSVEAEGRHVRQSGGRGTIRPRMAQGRTWRTRNRLDVPGQGCGRNGSQGLLFRRGSRGA